MGLSKKDVKAEVIGQYLKFKKYPFTLAILPHP